jgi:KDO2-lipid IV(A) lauroyltransferase
LPGFILKFFARLIQAVVFLFLRYRIEVVEANLKRSFPDYPPLRRQEIADRFYQHFSELFMEMIQFIRLKPKQLSRRIHFTDPEILRLERENNRNLIIVTGHYGNWEWDVAPFLTNGYRVIAVYKPQNSEFADELMRNIRQQPGLILVPMKETYRVIANELKKKDSPFVLLLIADQIPARVDIRFWTTFLNQDTAFFTGAEKLATRFGLPVYYLDQVKLKFARYEARIFPVYDGVSPTGKGDITRKFAELLEKSIRQAPHLWLWSHRRWKYPKDDLPLPA